MNINNIASNDLPIDHCNRIDVVQEIELLRRDHGSINSCIFESLTVLYNDSYWGGI